MKRKKLNWVSRLFNARLRALKGPNTSAEKLVLAAAYELIREQRERKPDAGKEDYLKAVAQITDAVQLLGIEVIAGDVAKLRRGG